VPIAVPLPKKAQLELSPQIGVVPNSGGNGAHMRYGGVIGVGVPLSQTLNAGAELAAFRDEDAAGHATKATFDLTLAWTPKALKDIQFDVGGAIGLNHQTPALEGVIGIAHRF
jgi:hypothetical protein